MTTERARSKLAVQTPRWLDARAAAAYLGVSTRTFYGHVRRDVRTLRIGSRVVFDIAELDKWAEARKEGEAPSEKEQWAIEQPAPNELRERLLNELQAQPDMKRMSNRTRELIEKLGKT